MSTATGNPTTVTCIGCGARIPSTVSICPYCVTPQNTSAAKKDDGDDPVRERLERMKEKPEYEAGLAYRPMEGPAVREATARGRRGLIFGAVGVALLASSFVGGVDWSAVSVVRMAAGAGLLAVGLAFGLRALGIRKRALALPLLVRPARVADRRSETEIRGAQGITTYYFDLQFDDGSRGEFFYPGRGAADEPLTNGVTGVAYTRGTELLAFKRVRV